MKNLIVLPMAFYVLYVFCLLLINFRRRVKAVKAKEIRMSYFTTYTGEVPEAVHVASRHFDNQFQVPVYFFIGCTAHLVIGQVNIFTLIVAWAFVASRIAHSFVHLGSNNVMYRMRTYALGWTLTFLLWGQLVMFALAATEANAAEVDHSKWLRCTAHTECVYVDGVCGEPQPVNQKFRNEADKYWKMQATAASCASVPARAKEYAIKCVEKKCTVIDGK